MDPGRQPIEPLQDQKAKKRARDAMRHLAQVSPGGGAKDGERQAVNPFHVLERQKFRPRPKEGRSINPEILEYYAEMDRETGLQEILDRIAKEPGRRSRRRAEQEDEAESPGLNTSEASKPAKLELVGPGKQGPEGSTGLAGPESYSPYSPNRSEGPR